MSIEQRPTMPDESPEEKAKRLAGSLELKPRAIDPIVDEADPRIGEANEWLADFVQQTRFFKVPEGSSVTLQAKKVGLENFGQGLRSKGPRVVVIFDRGDYKSNLGVFALNNEKDFLDAVENKLREDALLALG